MRVLWFTNTPSLYIDVTIGYGGGGWISSLQKEIALVPEIELGICFFHSDSRFKETRGNVCYYPVSLRDSFGNKLLEFFSPRKRDELELRNFQKIIDNFKPDVIHVFGTEENFGLIARLTDIPLVIHLQGILRPCNNAYFPPGMSLLDYFIYLNPLNALRKLKTKFVFTKNSQREMEIFRINKYFMGRTDWDKKITEIYSPYSKYFYCSEILRDPFYDTPAWRYRKKSELKIISTISKTDYKGFDVILKTALLIKQHTNLNFTWNVLGISDFRFWERKLKVKAVDVGVKLRGVASPVQIISEMMDSDIFVHPSYIDNSPNSTCEAQMVGIPVIASNVGGIRSLIQDGIDGVLVPANDPFMLVSYILELKKNIAFSEALGKKAREIALKRHNKEKIVAANLQIYKSILKL